MRESTRNQALRIIIGAMLLPLAGCSSVLGIESERTLDDTAKVTLPEEWSCLDETVPEPSSAAMLKQTFHFFDVTTPGMSKAIAGLTVRACPRIDFACDLPVGDAVTSDEGGIAVMSVPKGFNGYYEAAGLDNYQPYIIVEKDIQADSLADIPVASVAVAAAYAGAAGVKLQPGTGELLLTVRNCDQVATAGVSFEVNGTATGDESNELIYLANSLPTPGATETDTSGAAVIFNLDPGAVNASALVGEGTVTVASRSGLIRDGWETQMRFYPDQIITTPK